MRKYYLYALIDPDLDSPKYIGITNNPDKRLQEHIEDTAITKKTKWISSLKEGGKLPILKILRNTDNVHEVIKWEKEYIKELSNKYNLTNSTPGGEYFGIGTPIQVFDLDGNFLETYNSMVEYAELLGKSEYSSISAVCLRKRNYAYDRIFRYLDDTVTEEDLDKLRNCLHDRDRKHVFIISLYGEILGEFESIQQASKAGFGNSASISQVLNEVEGFYTVKGNFACCDLNDYQNKLRRYMGNTLPIQCYNLDGKHVRTFYKYSDAVKFCNCKSMTSIKACTIGKQKQAYGYRWKLTWDTTDI
nr:MAG TPA: intron associated endonuclease [Bacteriophage sp.]